MIFLQGWEQATIWGEDRCKWVSVQYSFVHSSQLFQSSKVNMDIATNRLNQPRVNAVNII